MRRSLLPICLGLTLVGCHSKSDVVGVWKDNQHPTNMAAALTSAFLPASSLELKTDHTFLLKLPEVQLSITGNSGSLQTDSWVEGTWMMEGDKVRFNTQTVAGKSLANAEKEIVAQVQQQSQATAPTSGTSPTMPPPPTVLPSQEMGWSTSNGFVKSSPQLAIPHDASLSDDQKRLLLHFADGVKPPIELERDKS